MRWREAAAENAGMISMPKGMKIIAVAEIEMTPPI